MSNTGDENVSKNGFSVSTETIAQGKIRVKTKIWMDHIELVEGVPKAIELYERTLAEYRMKGFKVDGDP